MNEDNANTSPDYSGGSHFEGLSEDDIRELIQVFIEDSGEQLDRLGEILLALERKNNTDSDIQDLYRIFHSFKGSAASFGFQKMSEIAHKLEDLLAPIRDNREAVTESLLEILYYSLDQFRLVLGRIQERASFEEYLLPLLTRINNYQGGDAAIPAAASESFQVKQELQLEFEKEIALREESIRIKLQKINRLIDLSSEMAVRKNYGQITIPKIMNVLGRIHEEEEYFRHYLQSRKDKGDGEGGGIELDERMKGHASFLEEINTALKGLLDDFSRWYFQLNILAEELRYEALMTRMFPFVRIAGPMKRLIRDLAQSLAKKVNLILDGEDTEVDRRILEGIKDPLMHLLRNAVDHGIESPEVRVKSGKSSVGIVRIKTVQKGNEIFISVSDDGNGIDIERVREKAREKLQSVFSEEDISLMDDEAVRQLIFYPGFSTARQTTDISGRGIGMDVVQANIKNLHGSIRVESREGKGTDFQIRIPSTLTIGNVLLFEIQDFTFAINTVSIERVSKVSLPENGGRALCGNVAYRGSEYPIIDLGALLGIPGGMGVKGRSGGKTDRERKLILLNPALYPFAILADRFLDTQEIVIRPMQLALPEAKFFSGITFLPDGSLAFIIDPSILHAEFRSWSAAALPGPSFCFTMEGADSIEGQSGLSLPIIPAVVGEEMVAIPAHWVLKRFKIPRPQKRSTGGRRKLVLGSKKVALLDLGQLLAIKTNPDPVEVIVLLCKINNRHAALEIDDALPVSHGLIKAERQADGTDRLFAVTQDGTRLRIPDAGKIVSTIEKYDDSLNLKDDDSAAMNEGPGETVLKAGKKESLLACCEVAGKRLGIEFSAVHEIIPSVASYRFDCDSSNPRGFVNLRGECIEIFNLGKWLRGGDMGKQPEESLIITLQGDNKRGLIVERVRTEVEFLSCQSPFELPSELGSLFPCIYELGPALD